jgi:hypothetical protein
MNGKGQGMNKWNTALDENTLTPPRTPDLSAKKQEGVYLENIHLNKTKQNFKHNNNQTWLHMASVELKICSLFQKNSKRDFPKGFVKRYQSRGILVENLV